MPLKPDLPPGSTNYAIAVDATNFSADHMIMGQRLDAAVLHVTANTARLPAQRRRQDRAARRPISNTVKRVATRLPISALQGMLDETARNNLGLDPTNAISGAVPIQLTGRVATTADRDGRFAVEADLTSAQIDGFLPGWVKPAGKPARVTFTLTTKPQSIRIDDLVIEGAGDGVKGTVEFDGSGELQSANFPSYGFSDGDQATLKVDRTQDGALRVVMRGDVYDGRGFIKTLTGGPPSRSAADQAPARRHRSRHEARRRRRLQRRGAAQCRSENVAPRRRNPQFRPQRQDRPRRPLTGDLRSRAGGRQMIALTTGDGGALFRFTDVYARMNGGQMVIAMDAPSADNPLQQGSITVRQFAVHDEAQLQHAVNTERTSSPA